MGARREEALGSHLKSSAWFRQYSFWGWQDSLDYSSLVSLPSRLARGRDPAARTRSSTWRRSSVQPLWRAATKQMARNERLRYGFDLDGASLEIILRALLDPALQYASPKRVWASQILVEVIVHMYVHARGLASDAVTAMLRELALAPEPHLRVTALEIIVNAALRTQLLLDWCPAPDSEEPAHSEHQELVEGANKDLRFQLLRLIALAFHEELLDAQMSDMAISGVLLLCTHDGHFDHMLRTHLPLEALAALVSHSSSNATALHADGAAQAVLVDILAGLLHEDHEHIKHPSSRDTSICASPSSPAWALSPDTSREDDHAEGGQWGVQGFEKRLRRVGGIRWVLLQLRAARSASARELLYSVPLSGHLVPLAAIRATLELDVFSGRASGCCALATDDFVQQKESRTIIVRYILTAVVEARNQEGESSSDDDATTQQPPELTEAEGDEGWERACIRAVQVMDDLAMPHALAQALWAVPPQFSILFAAHVDGELTPSERRSEHEGAAAHALFAALEQVCCLFSQGQHEEEEEEVVCSLTLSQDASADGRRGQERGQESEEESELYAGCARGNGQMGFGNVADEMNTLTLLVSDDCSKRDAGVNKLFAYHLHVAAKGGGHGGASGGGGQGGSGARGCTPANAHSSCHICDQKMHSERDTVAHADKCAGVNGWSGDITGVCGPGGGERTERIFGACLMDVEYSLLQRDPRVCLGIIELTRKLLVHYKMLWAGCSAESRETVSLDIQQLVAHRLEAVVSAVGEDAEVMTPKCLISILDIVFSLVAVGIPERVQTRNEEVEETAAEGESEEEEELEEDTDGNEKFGMKDLGHEALSPQWTKGDTLECLLLDGTLAVQLTALQHAPWRVMHYVCERLPLSHLAARRTLVLLLYTAYRLAPQHFVESVCELSDLDTLAEACGCALASEHNAGGTA